MLYHAWNIKPYVGQAFSLQREHMQPGYGLEGPANTTPSVCAVAVLSNDYMHLRPYQVNCSAEYYSRIICEQNVSSSLLKNEHRIFGYFTDIETHTAKLVGNAVGCPIGWNMYIHNQCVKFVRLTKTPHVAYCSDLKSAHLTIYVWLTCSRINELILPELRIFHQQCQEDDPLARALECLNGSNCKQYNHLLKTRMNTVYPMRTIVWFIETLDFEIIEGSCYNQVSCGSQWSTDGKYITMHNSSLTYEPNIFVACSRPVVSTVFRDPLPLIDYFKCVDGSFIASVFVCDGYSDCVTSEDEQNCTDICSEQDTSVEFCFRHCEFPRCTCHIFYYQCEHGGCIPLDKLCDGIADCLDSDDEQQCVPTFVSRPFGSSSENSSIYYELCTQDSLQCKSQSTCYPVSAICHYDLESSGSLAHCADGTHLGREAACEIATCHRQFKCVNSYCIPTRMVCNGQINCPNGDDEICGAELGGLLSCPGHLKCSGTSFCVPPWEVCDGNVHCPHQDDEKFCNLCFKGCKCHGNTIHCVNASAWREPLVCPPAPSALILRNAQWSLLHQLLKCDVSMWYHLVMIDIYCKVNGFNLSSEQIIFPLMSMNGLLLRTLNVHHCALTSLDRHAIPGGNTNHVNVSFNRIATMNADTFALAKKVRILDLSSNHLTHIARYYFAHLTRLRYLYLTRNPIGSVSHNAFIMNVELTRMRSDWYMLCCVVVRQTNDCLPTAQLVSSCSDLLRSTVQRLSIVVQGVTALVANVVVIVINLYVRGIEYRMFISLALSDALMGLYLLLFSYVDISNKGIFYDIISYWTQSSTCLVLAIFHFVSYEMSLVTICLLFLIRMLSLGTVGKIRSMQKKVVVVCVCFWLLVVLLSCSYAYFVHYNSIALKNNMCIMFSVSQSQTLLSYDYVSYTIFLISNTMFICVLLVSGVGIYNKVNLSSESISKMSGSKRAEPNRAKITNLKIRLGVLFCLNVICVVPVLVITVCSLSGTSVDDTWQQWIIVLVVPITATTNPLVYNIVAIKNIWAKRGRQIK